MNDADRRIAIRLFLIMVFCNVSVIAIINWTDVFDLSGSILLPLIAMALPTIAVVTLRFSKYRQFRSYIVLSRLSILYVIGAVLIFPLVMHAVMLPTAFIMDGTIHLEPWLRPDANGFFNVPPPRDWGSIGKTGLVTKLVISAMVGLLIVAILAIMEEIGWRGWLLPQLSVLFGPRKAVVYVAIVWAAWHLPLILSGIMDIDGVSRLALLGILPIGHFGAGLILGWFWIRTRSIWVVTLGHASLNNWGQYAFKFINDVGGYDTAILLSGNIALCVVGVWFLRLVASANVQDAGQSAG